MNGERHEPTRWFGAFRSDGSAELPEPIADALIATRRGALGRLMLGVGGGLALPVAIGALAFSLESDALMFLLVITAFAGPILAATALVKYGEIAWRYRSVRAGSTVERFAGRAPQGFDDTVTKRLRKRKLVEDARPHTLLVAPETGVVLAVDDAASSHAVRGTIAETAPLRAEDDLTRPLDPLERAELAGVMDRMHKLPVGNCFAIGWVATAVLRIVFLRDPEMVEWFNTLGWTVWFGIAAVLLVLAQLYNWLRLSALRGEREGPLEVLRANGADGAAPPVAGFPQSGVIWQYGLYPGPARLEGGGLRGKVARKARG